MVSNQSKSAGTLFGRHAVANQAMTAPGEIEVRIFSASGEHRGRKDSAAVRAVRKAGFCRPEPEAATACISSGAAFIRKEPSPPEAHGTTSVSLKVAVQRILRRGRPPTLRIAQGHNDVKDWVFAAKERTASTFGRALRRNLSLTFV